MARIRSLKIGFFRDEVLCELSPWHRLLFAGLWVVADREGRLEDRPRRIKADVFPYNDVDVDPLLKDLEALGFIQRYEVEGQRCIFVTGFHRHQLISREEPASELPGPDGTLTYYERPPNETIRARIYQRDRFACVYCQRDMGKTPRLRCVDHVIPYIRGGSHREDNLVTACKRCNSKKGGRTPSEAQMTWPEGFGSWLTGGQPPVNGSGQVLGIGNRELGNGKESLSLASARERACERETLSEVDIDRAFAEFRNAYPASRRVGGVAGRRAFISALNTRRSGDSRASHFAEMLAALASHVRSEQWRNPRFIPLMTTWLNQERWLTELPASTGSALTRMLQQANDEFDQIVKGDDETTM